MPDPGASPAPFPPSAIGSAFHADGARAMPRSQSKHTHTHKTVFHSHAKSKILRALWVDVVYLVKRVAKLQFGGSEDFTRHVETRLHDREAKMLWKMQTKEQD